MGAPAQAAAGDHRRWILWFVLIQLNFELNAIAP
jgi:hypothetical protein